MTSISKISSMSKEQKLLLKKSMSKKAYKDYCRRYRSTMTLGRNYGTRWMASDKDVARVRKSVAIDDYEMTNEEIGKW